MIRLLIHRNTVLPNGDWVDNGWITHDIHDGWLEKLLSEPFHSVAGAEIRKDVEPPRLHMGAQNKQDERER